MISIDDLKNIKSEFSHYSAFPFRHLQAEAAQFAINSTKKIVVLEAATGAGKSLIGMIIGASVSKMAYLVHSKVLQNQITGDFPEATSLFGRSNYQCLANPDQTCEQCSHSKFNVCAHHKAYDDIIKDNISNSLNDAFDPCPYKMQKANTLMARFKVLNYDYFLSEVNYIGKFSGQHTVIVDEADNLEGTLINFVTLTFTRYALRRIGMDEQAASLKMTSKNKSALIDSWKEFGQQSLCQVNIIIKRINKIISSSKIMTQQVESNMDELKKVVRLKEKITLFLDNVDDTWMLDNQSDKLIFRPLWMNSGMADKYLWNHADKFVLMSASFYPRPILAKTLGLDTDDIDYHMIPSQFPIGNRPVYVAPAVNLTAKTLEVEIPKLIPAIRSIVDSRPNVKGIIHAVSYSLSHRIVGMMKDDRYITHNSDNRQQILDLFMKSDLPLVLVSPSLERGTSLADDLCRLVIIAKAPYLSLGDKIVSARLYSSRMGSDWYKATMMLTVLQMSGRAVRSATDYAECFILDDQIQQAITSRPGFLPSWWIEACEFRLPD